MLWNTQSYLLLGRELISCKLSEWCVWLFHTCGTRKRVPLSSPGHPATKWLACPRCLDGDSDKKLARTGGYSQAGCVQLQLWSFFLRRAACGKDIAWLHFCLDVLGISKGLARAWGKSRTDGAYPIQRTPTCKQDHATHCILGVLPW